jgi:hypothetical protein
MGVCDRSKIVELERGVLRLMCRGELDQASVADACRELASYSWQDHDNRVVFDALARVRNVDLIPIRAQLAEHATRMGFPDIDWGNFLQPAEEMLHPIDRQQLQHATEALLASQIRPQ